MYSQNSGYGPSGYNNQQGGNQQQQRYDQGPDYDEQSRGHSQPPSYEGQPQGYGGQLPSYGGQQQYGSQQPSAGYSGTQGTYGPPGGTGADPYGKASNVYDATQQKQEKKGFTTTQKVLGVAAGVLAAGGVAYGAKKIIEDIREDSDEEREKQKNQAKLQQQQHQHAAAGGGHKQQLYGAAAAGAGYSFDPNRNSQGSATPHAYPLLNQNPGDPIVKIGTKLALKHNMTGRFLRCDQSRMTQSGSNQLIAYANQWQVSGEDFWQVLPANRDVIPPGTPVSYGQMIRLRHVQTKRHLHSHRGFAAPINKGQQEVTVFGDEMTSDDNDHWIVDRFGSGCSGTPWNAGDAIIFRHKATGLYLHSHDHCLANNMQEVTCFGDGHEENDKWRVHFN